MVSTNPLQSFDWTAINLHRAFDEWLEEVCLFLEFQKFEGEERDNNNAKAANILKKKKSWFIYFLGEEANKYIKNLIFKNAEGESIETMRTELLKWLRKYPKGAGQLRT